MTPWKRELDARLLKEAKIKIKKGFFLKNYFQILVKKNVHGSYR